MNGRPCLSNNVGYLTRHDSLRLWLRLLNCTQLIEAEEREQLSRLLAKVKQHMLGSTA